MLHLKALATAYESEAFITFPVIKNVHLYLFYDGFFQAIVKHPRVEVMPQP
jgi:hypothetical protein